MSVAVQSTAEDRSRILTTATVRAADVLGISGTDLSDIIGLSDSSVSRMRNDGYWLEEGTKPFELAAVFVRFFRSLDAITGGDDNVAKAWMRNANQALGGVPLDQIKTISGLMNGLTYLDSRRAPL